jgi:hypothetical protein
MFVRAPVSPKRLLKIPDIEDLEDYKINQNE